MSNYVSMIVAEILQELQRQPDLQYSDVEYLFDRLEQTFQDDLTGWEAGCKTYSSVMTSLYAAKGCICECEIELSSLLACAECMSCEEEEDS